MRFQSGLGKVKEGNDKIDRAWNQSGLALGKVIKVHNKRYTADVQILDSTDSYASSGSNEGINACRILCKSAGFSTRYQKPYGEVIPLHKGDLVVIGFLKPNGGSPIILGTLHDNSEEKGAINKRNILTSAYPLDSDESERYMKVNDTQDYYTTDRDGNFELVSHTRAFIKGTQEDYFNEENFDFYDLSLRDEDGEVLSPDPQYCKPMKYLAVFRSTVLNSIRDSIRVFIDPIKQIFRIWSAKGTDSSLSSFSIEEDGSIVLQRQHDSSYFGNNDSRIYTRMSIKKNGEFHIDLSTQYGRSQILIDNNAVQVNTSENIILKSDKNITIKGDNINLEGNVNVKGDSRFTGTMYNKGDIVTKGGISASGTFTGESDITIPEIPKKKYTNKDIPKEPEAPYEVPNLDDFLPDDYYYKPDEELYESFEPDDSMIDPYEGVEIQEVFDPDKDNKANQEKIDKESGVW